MRKVDFNARYEEDLNNWVRREENIFTIGLTDFAQTFVGEVASITDLPNIGALFSKGAIYAVIESNKASTEVCLPIGGRVIEVNDRILLQPNRVNEDCYGEGWVVKLDLVEVAEWESLQSSEAYAKAIKEFFNK